MYAAYPVLEVVRRKEVARRRRASGNPPSLLVLVLQPPFLASLQHNYNLPSPQLQPSCIPPCCHPYPALTSNSPHSNPFTHPYSNPFTHPFQSPSSLFVNSPTPPPPPIRNKYNLLIQGKPIPSHREPASSIQYNLFTIGHTGTYLCLKIQNFKD